ncbi:MAG: peptidoglycan editing factor PgeF [Alphaproteobacteria bacterium]|nr:peptidoglycan editing factor PgeF [Alphaproteobacteria bacterium]
MITPKNFLDLTWLSAGFYDKTECALVEAPILMHQVHSADVLELEQSPQESPSVDALVTRLPNLNLTIKTADCAPIFLVDTKAKIVAAIHAGWKGALQGIIETTILKMLSMGAEISAMRAAIGPHLQRESFEISRDMVKLFPETERALFISEVDGLILFDFDAYLIHRLRRTGITNIDSVGVDTYTSNDYNSYRREPDNPARQYSSIMIKEV